MKGCDCTGMILGIMKNLGEMASYVLPPYARDWNLHNGADEHLEIEFGNLADVVPNDQVQIGDVLLFKFGRCQSHAGVYIGDGLFIHCFFAARKCTTSMLPGSIWQQRLTKVFRFNEQKLLSVR